MPALQLSGWIDHIDQFKNLCCLIQNTEEEH